jgi:hypothetical protein
VRGPWSRDERHVVLGYEGLPRNGQVKSAVNMIENWRHKTNYSSTILVSENCLELTKKPLAG